MTLQALLESREWQDFAKPFSFFHDALIREITLKPTADRCFFDLLVKLIPSCEFDDKVVTLLLEKCGKITFGFDRGAFLVWAGIGAEIHAKFNMDGSVGLFFDIWSLDDDVEDCMLVAEGSRMSVSIETQEQAPRCGP